MNESLNPIAKIPAAEQDASAAEPAAPVADQSMGEYLQILRRAIRLTWRQAPEATLEDIAQDACMKVMQALAKQPRPDRPEAYVYRVGANAALDALRKARRLRETEMVEVADTLAQPDRQAGQAQQMDQLMQALSTLSEARQTAVRLYLLGYRPPDTAAVTGWSQQKVRNLVYRGLKELRRALARQGFDHELE